MSGRKENRVGALRAFRNGSGKKKPPQFVPCISKDLYDEPPQSEYVIAQMFYSTLHLTFIILSKFCIGQLLISILDYYMIKIENTLDFCLPDSYDNDAQKVIDKHKTLPVHDRAMSWLFFIPVLIFLRMLRFVLSVYCIMSGKGEVTAEHMQVKVIAFRRYYRSIRHYAVDKWTEEDIKLVNERKEWMLWRVYYRIYESIFMTRPIVEHHNCSPNKEAGSETGKPNGRDKQSLNAGQADIDDSNSNARARRCVNASSSHTADPDCNTGNLNKSFESIDSEEEASESLRKLNDEFDEDLGENSMANSKHSSNVSENSENDKSNDDDLSLTSSQMNELENEITMKILNYFKEHYNFPSTSYTHDNFSNEIFYSPIGSPQEREFSSKAEAQNNQQSSNSAKDHNE